MRFWEYELSAETLLIGERIKKGTFRPVVPAMTVNDYRPLPYSTAAGALREFLGLGFDIPIHVHAAGYITEGTEESLVIAPRDNVTGVSKFPITIQYLSGIKGKLFILLDEYTNKLPDEFNMVMGGMRYKGFGSCHLKRRDESLELKTSKGTLLTRIPQTAFGAFGIQINAGDNGPYRWGYLFKPTSETGGVYVRSLFEGSEVEAYEFLLEVKDDNSNRTG